MGEFTYRDLRRAFGVRRLVAAFGLLESAEMPPRLAVAKDFADLRPLPIPKSE